MIDLDKFGTKHKCHNCSCIFYDMRATAPNCPDCKIPYLSQDALYNKKDPVEFRSQNEFPVEEVWTEAAEDYNSDGTDLMSEIVDEELILDDENIEG